MGSFDGVQVMRAVSWRDMMAFMQQQRQGRLAATTINRRRMTLGVQKLLSLRCFPPQE
jgi:hypothetical protein